MDAYLGRADRPTRTAVLVTHLDDDRVGKSIHVYRFDGQAWAFVAHADDPGLDYLVFPSGETREVYTHDGTNPHGVPQGLWEAYMEDCLGWAQ
jgi:hypothetical protein